MNELILKILGSDWLVLLIVGATLLLATEFGYRVGGRHTPERKKSHQPQIGSLQGALLGLFGLLLGFTFAMSVGRYEARKQLVLDEANAIGTAWLRAGLLSDWARDTIRDSMRDYVDARLAGAKATGDPKAFAEQAARSERNQAAMWGTTVAETRSNNTPAMALFTASLNDMIDMDGKRQAAMRNHVPPTVWLLLVVVAVTVCWTTGYSSGLGEAGRHLLPMLVLPVLLTIVMTIIADIDNPREGLIQVSQQSMVDLQNTLKKYQ